MCPHLGRARFIFVSYFTQFQISQILSSAFWNGLVHLRCRVQQSNFTGVVAVHSVTQTLYDPMDCSTPGFPVLHHLPEFAQTHIHWVIICHPLLLLLSIFPNIRVFSNESALHIRWPKYWSFSFSISSSTEYSGLISFRIGWFDLLPVHGILKSLLCTTIWNHQFFGTQPSLWSNSHIYTWLLEKP